MNYLGFHSAFPFNIIIPVMGDYTVASSAPRILLNDTDTLAAFQAQRAGPTAAYTRVLNMANTELASPGNYWEYRYATSGLIGYLLNPNSTTNSHKQFAHDKMIDWLETQEAAIDLGNAPTIARDNYLYSGYELADLLVTMDWCRAEFTSDEIQRVLDLTNQCLYNIWNHTVAEWGGVSRPWSGWAVNDPANNYYYAFMKATMFGGLATYGDQPAQAQIWLDKFSEKMEQLNTYFVSYLADGGSHEGTGYGNAIRGLFEVDYLWKKSTGQNLYDLNEHAEKSTYWMAQIMTPGRGRVAPIGDHARDSTAEFYDYHREVMMSLLYLYPASPGARSLKSLVDDVLPVMEYSNNFWVDLYYANNSTELPPETLNTDYYNSSVGMFTTRSSWATNAVYLYMMAGPFTQSHAHQDQGHFGIAAGDTPLFEDANIYGSSGIVPHEAIHNQVVFYDSAIADTSPPGIQYGAAATPWVKQIVSAPATQILALAANANFSYIVADIKPIYNSNAKVVKAQRELLFIKPGCFVVCDRYTSNASTVYRQFGLNMGVAPTVDGDKISITNSGKTADCWRVAPTGLSWTVETLATQQYMAPNVATQNWTGVRRAYCTHSSGTETVFLHVISINSNVSTIAANNAAGQTGVDIVFADGKTATVRFNNTTTGGTLDYKTSGAVDIFNAVLPSTVVIPPLLAA